MRKEADEIWHTPRLHRAISGSGGHRRPGRTGGDPQPLGAATSVRVPLRLGGPVFVSTEDPEALAVAHRKLGYRAAYCPGVDLKDSAKIRAYAEAFAQHDVVIAEVGRWVNLLDGDAEKRRRNLQTVTDGLALAEAIGALNCVDIAGSFNPTSWFGPHPDNLSPRFFDAIVENARRSSTRSIPSAPGSPTR